MIEKNEYLPVSPVALWKKHLPRRNSTFCQLIYFIE